jgi:hypothetical protein
MTLVPEITCQIEAIAGRMIGPEGYCVEALREIASALSGASNHLWRGSEAFGECRLRERRPRRASSSRPSRRPLRAVNTGLSASYGERHE